LFFANPIPTHSFQENAVKAVRKRSCVIDGHKTSVSLEEPFWRELKRVAEERGMSLGRLIEQIDARRGKDNLSSSLRVFVLERCLERSATGTRSRGH
jgi:predicted DNA-binding ribbon-helix-helix protein